MSKEVLQSIPGVEFWTTPAWILCRDFVEIDYANSPLVSHIKAYTVDIENVATDGIDGGDPTVRPEALDAFERIHNSGRALLLMTNCKDAEFVGDVQGQVNDHLGLSGEAAVQAITKVTAGKSKVHAEPFFQATNRLRINRHHMAHIDDQFQAHLGAVQAGFGIHIWPEPYGEHQRSGVRRFRPVEMTAIRGLVRLNPRSRVYSDDSARLTNDSAVES